MAVQDGDAARSFCDEPTHRPKMPNILSLLKDRWLFITALAFSVVTVLFLLSGIPQVCTDRRTESYHPTDAAFDDSLASIRFQRTQIQGDFATESVFKGPPSDALDHAWDSISMGNVFGVTGAALDRMNKSRENASRLTSQSRGTYMASLEIYHQLHCLNMIRKIARISHYRDDPMISSFSEADLDAHFDHCVDILRQVLMCAGDVGGVTYYWEDGRKDPMPDFSTWKTCRNFDDIQSWVESRSHFSRYLRR